MSYLMFKERYINYLLDIYNKCLTIEFNVYFNLTHNKMFSVFIEQNIHIRRIIFFYWQ